MALKRLVARLGPDWRVIVSDVTAGTAGNGERLAFLYYSTRVQPAVLVGEVVLPPIGRSRSASSLAPPASFTRVGSSSPLRPCTFSQARTRPSGCRRSPRSPSGDTTGRSGPTTRTRTVSTSLWPPAELNAVPRTIFDDDKIKHFYDQPAWFSKSNGTSLPQGLVYAERAGTFGFIPHVSRDLPAFRCRGGSLTTTRSGANNSCSYDVCRSCTPCRTSRCRRAAPTCMTCSVKIAWRGR